MSDKPAEQKHAGQGLLDAAILGKASAEHRLAEVCGERDRLKAELERARADKEYCLAANVLNEQIERTEIVERERDRLRAENESQRKLFSDHTSAVAAFLNELYAIMVDPLADGTIHVVKMKEELKRAALRDREAELKNQAVRVSRDELLAALKKAVQGTRNLVEFGVLQAGYRTDAKEYVAEYEAIIQRAEASR